MKFFIILATLIAAASAGSIEQTLQMLIREHQKTLVDINIVLGSMEDLYTQVSVSNIDENEVVPTLIAQAHNHTRVTQAPIVDFLLEHGVSQNQIEQFWISNEIYVKGADASTIEALKALKIEFVVQKPIQVQLVEPELVEQEIAGFAAMTQNGVQWGVQTVNAPAAWSKTKGQGAVVAILDTGVYREHEALKNNYAGAWYDPYYGSASPNDQHGHGTHALGSAVGANGIGVAPGAKWIACRGLSNEGSGTADQMLKCAQWIMTANPRPHVVSNSWSGGQGSSFYNNAISAWRAAGIVPVFAIGNAGSSCGSANSPGDQPGVLSVGATQQGDSMASFSSRGPALGSNIQKPEVSAPGQNILSAGNSGSNAYRSMSGTSMATPHVAGAVALIKSLQPNMSVDNIISRLQSTGARPPVAKADRDCGRTEWPNMAYGYGRINAAAALP